MITRCLAALLLVLPLCVSGQTNLSSFGAIGDGVSDNSDAFSAAFTALADKGQQILVPNGTYVISRPLVVPSRFQIIGTGRGDAFAWNTVIKAGPNFPLGAPLVVMGSDAGPDFGIQVKNMTLDGSGIVSSCLVNTVSEELSYAEDLLLTQCHYGLVVIGSGAQNSGPYRNLEIYPTGGSDATCVTVSNVISFRGVEGVTCNGSGADSENIGLWLDGQGFYSDIHAEHVETAVLLGTPSGSADGMTIANVHFGPSVKTGIDISNRPGNQNITLIGLSCVGCSALLQDDVMGITNNHTSLGFYALGDGAGSSKPLLSNASGIPSRN